MAGPLLELVQATTSRERQRWNQGSCLRGRRSVAKAEEDYEKHVEEYEVECTPGQMRVSGTRYRTQEVVSYTYRLVEYLSEPWTIRIGPFSDIRLRGLKRPYSLTLSLVVDVVVERSRTWASGGDDVAKTASGLADIAQIANHYRLVDLGIAAAKGAKVLGFVGPAVELGAGSYGSAWIVASFDVRRVAIESKDDSLWLPHLL